MDKLKDQVELWRQHLDKKLQEKNALTSLLQQAEEKTGVPRIYITFGVITATCLWLYLNGIQMLCYAVGFLYPAYASIKAIESSSKEDDTQWLIYWVVYSVFSLSELFSDILLTWIPFYWFLKCAFLFWCMGGKTWNGSAVIYLRVIRPLFIKHQSKIEAKLNNAKRVTGTLLDEGSKLAESAAGAAAAAVVQASMNKSN